MRICERASELRVVLAGAPRRVGLVPTMGALHEGHAANFRRCRSECATAVASVFVNPLQFDDPSDLQKYPRPFESDCVLLEREGIDVVFHPSVEEFAPKGFTTRVAVGPPGVGFEALHRKGHFEGVATVVTKLFHLVEPDRAYFGRKDLQQLALIRKLVRDLQMDVEIIPVETVREADGLALSSRNVRLDGVARQEARGLSRGLFRAREAWKMGERRPATLVEAAREPGLNYDYLACVNPDTFEPPRRGEPAAVVAAVRIAGVRLLDNVFLEPADIL